MGGREHKKEQDVKRFSDLLKLNRERSWKLKPVNASSPRGSASICPFPARRQPVSVFDLNPANLRRCPCPLTSTEF